MGDETALLRHTVAALAYRGGKTLRGAPPEFSDFRAGGTTRTPGQILAHISDLLDWALSLADGKGAWHDSAPLTWDEGSARFFTAIEAFDKRLALEAPLACSAERLFQGPIADALTHVGQIAMLRRLAGYPIRGENYYKANIFTGRVGSEQAKAKFEFE
jgi:hypothetical protein